ncbi:class II fructose-bisphosphate aldolase [Lacrimispora sp.]|uniref:class II fructose-bisphosphate aldolase n=1 Tax=Lacrimispora sp. TaxID=2719234 RepID=UPI0028A1B955|nr:class II fructose-bisphosphate aldolase [Lacrimispora sp.]
MITPMHVLLQDAKKRKYGIAAPNCFNRETIEACFKAADKLHSPIILDVSGVHGIEECAHIARFYELRYPNVSFAVNLDHGGPYEHIIRAIRAGFSSVMADRSTLPYEDNIREVNEIVKIAHAVGVTVEAELGHVGVGLEYEETRDAGLTRPEEAVEFVKRTGIDCLAIAIGTSHGVYKGAPHLEFDLLEKIAGEVEIPLVLHGGSGTGDENIKKAIGMGIQKVNLWTDLSVEAIAGVKDAMHSEENKNSKKGDEFATKKLNFQQYVEIGAGRYQEKLEHYIKLFGSDGKN